ncbi:metallophosphoesterase [Brucella gallinifaecis]|uniref:metallophosphoesterase n=1 Tax=Brucella gallinifaecis TaxID=215590 RepID=UPI00235F9B1A|nr:metallophosphoesterase [Brucella gallinifaecis]
MKIWAISDLHLKETDPLKFGSKIKIPAADLCVLAGDIADDLLGGLNWVGQIICPHMPVVMVLGNHDYFNRSLITGVAEAREIAKHAVKKRNLIGGIEIDDSGNTILHHPIYILDDDAELKIKSQKVRFIGSTLWSDFAIEAPAGAPADIVEAYRNNALSEMKGRMPEYQLTSFGSRMMSPYDAYATFQNSKKALIDKLAKPYDGMTIIVTHNAPHRNSISEHFGLNLLTTGFVSDLSDVIDEYQPDFWFHGHVHHSLDYHVGKTRIICHPKGNGNPDFAWSKGIIDLNKTKEFA